MSNYRQEFKAKLIPMLRKTYRTVTAPLAILFLTYSTKVHPEYGMSWFKRMKLGYRFWRNHNKVNSGSSWRAHLVMAMRLLEISPSVAGDVVECGCWKGCATINLSLIAAITGRKLKVYDSFEGLPPPAEGDPAAQHAFRNGFIPGILRGTLEEVTANVRQYGAIDACEFHKGWFKDTLPLHKGNIVLAYWDVDFYASLHDCLVNLWPSVVDGGYVFLDEFRNVPYCAVFFSEKYWNKYFSSVPPGLMGVGTGVQVGMFYTDNTIGGMGAANLTRIQGPESVAYCVKGTRAIWDYYPDEIEQTRNERLAASSLSPGN